MRRGDFTPSFYFKIMEYRIEVYNIQTGKSEEFIVDNYESESDLYDLQYQAHLGSTLMGLFEDTKQE